jgi:hypothetical protein
MRLAVSIWLGWVGFAAVSACANHIADGSAPQPLLEFQLTQDSLRPVRNGAVVQVTVKFVVHNVSGQTVYRTNDCGGSPRYWVERLETDSSGGKTWRQVFSADCTGRDPPRKLSPRDSALFVSYLVSFPDQSPAFAFSNSSDVYRFVYVVSTSPDVAAEDIRVTSPPVVIPAST